ncbi:hypothetical protein [Thioflexithrix psekupsensis]|uniref:Uncharacterized protein n=1 Tax=Thioflexithrix psekupsensis TaxID=1570016 RepID=A0A251XCJ6_9GAMM|nr:hypothetical protein [Thioflexithrix psekupsensis]OUD15635.1 hypothetical protein TPSD3_03705 [Thioflexithrix psekupsensis]
MSNDLIEQRVKLLMTRAVQHERKFVEVERQLAELNRVLAQHSAALAQLDQTAHTLKPLFELSESQAAELSDEQLHQLQCLINSELSRRQARERFRLGYLHE